MSDDLLEQRQRIVRRHLLIGWWGLLLFLSLGIVLETLHGFKVGYYLDPGNKMRRLLWTLAHAHGTLLAVVNIVYAVSLPQLPAFPPRRLKLTSFFLLDALALLPLGFFLGGLSPAEGDPGVGVLLVPIGALFLLAAVAMIAVTVSKRVP